LHVSKAVSVRLFQVNPATRRASFAGNLPYTNRVDGGNLATPQPQKSPKTPQNVTQATFKYVFRSVRDLPHTFLSINK